MRLAAQLRSLPPKTELCNFPPKLNSVLKMAESYDTETVLLLKRMNSSKILPSARFSRKSSSRFWKSLRAAQSRPACQLAGWTRRVGATTTTPSSRGQATPSLQLPQLVPKVCWLTYATVFLWSLESKRPGWRPGPEPWARTAGSAGRPPEPQTPATTDPSTRASGGHQRNRPEQRSRRAVTCWPLLRGTKEGGGNSVSVPSNLSW